MGKHKDKAYACVLCGERFRNESEVATQSLFADGTTAWWSALTRDYDAAEAGSLELVGPVCFVCATVPAMAAARATAYAADLRELAAKVEGLAERVAAGNGQNNEDGQGS